MKTITQLSLALVILTASILTLDAQTNVVLTNALPLIEEPIAPAPEAVQKIMEQFKPIFDLIGTGPLVTKVVLILALASTVLAPFSVWISHRLRDWMNSAAMSSQLEDDEFLRQRFSKKWYVVAAFLFRFVNIDFPVLSDLERAIKLQQEAVADAAKAQTQPR